MVLIYVLVIIISTILLSVLFYFLSDDEPDEIMFPIVFFSLLLSIGFCCLLSCVVFPFMFGEKMYNVNTKVYKLENIDVVENKTHYILKNEEEDYFYYDIKNDQTGKIRMYDFSSANFKHIKESSYNKPVLKVKHYKPIGINSYLYLTVEEEKKNTFFLPSNSICKISNVLSLEDAI